MKFEHEIEILIENKKYVVIVTGSGKYSEDGCPTIINGIIADIGEDYIEIEKDIMLGNTHISFVPLNKIISISYVLKAGEQKQIIIPADKLRKRDAEDCIIKPLRASLSFKPS